MVDTCAAQEPAGVRTLAKIETNNIGRKFPNALPAEMTLGTSDPRIGTATLNVLDCVAKAAQAKGDTVLAAQTGRATQLYQQALGRLGR